MRRLSRSGWFALALCALAGIAGRCLMFRAGVWRDEATSYFTAALPSVHAVLARVSYVELNPPGFFVVLHFWMRCFGRGEFVLKLLPLLFAIVALGVSYAIARRVTISRGALVFVAALLSANFGCAYYATELRPYSMAECFILIGFVCCIAARDNRSKPDVRYEIVGGLALAIAVYVSYVSVFAVAAIALGALALRLPFSRLLRFEAAFVAVPAILSLPLLPLIRVQHSYNFLPPLPIAHRPFAFLTLIGQAVVTDSRHGALLLGLIVLALSLYSLWHGLQERSDVRSVAIVLITLTFLLTCASEAALSLNEARYAIPILPLGTISVALALIRLFSIARDRFALSSARSTLAAASLTVVILIVGIGQQIDASAHHKSAIAGLPARLPHASNVAYLIAPDFDAQTFAYYNGSAKNVYGFARWSPSDVFDLRGYGALWADPSAVDTAMAHVRELAKNGIAELIFVRMGPFDESMTRSDGIPFGRTDDLRARLLATYPVLAHGCAGSDRNDLFARVYALRLGAGAPAAALGSCTHDGRTRN